MLIKVTRGGKIPRKDVQYANKDVFYTLEAEVPNDTPDADLKALRDSMAKSLDDKIEQDFAEEGHRQQVIFIKQPYRDGKFYYHVSQILNPTPPAIPHIEEHAYVGTFIQDPIYNWIRSGEFKLSEGVEWKQPEHIKEGWEDYNIADWYKAHGLARKVGFTNEIERKVWNDEYGYMGKFDILGVIGDEITVFDLKKSKDIKGDTLATYLMQLSAYAKCIPDVKKICIISPHKQSKTPIIIEEDIDKYFQMFLSKLAEFKRRFNL